MLRARQPAERRRRSQQPSCEYRRVSIAYCVAPKGEYTDS